MAFEIKELEWREVLDDEGASWYTETPTSWFGDNIYIEKVGDEFWTRWDLTPHASLDEAKQHGQELHNTYLTQYLVQVGDRDTREQALKEAADIALSHHVKAAARMESDPAEYDRHSACASTAGSIEYAIRRLKKSPL